MRRTLHKQMMIRSHKLEISLLKPLCLKSTIKLNGPPSGLTRALSLRIPHSRGQPGTWRTQNHQESEELVWSEEDCIWDLKNTPSDHVSTPPRNQDTGINCLPCFIPPFTQHSPSQLSSSWFLPLLNMAPSPFLDHCPRLLPGPLLCSHSTLAPKENFLKYIQVCSHQTQG